MRACGENRDDGTWITEAMRTGYGELHRLGDAHSVEVWQGADLVGGVYGVQVGGVFAAESMFHRVTDASKVALVTLARHLFASGIELIEVQFVTPHLARMGAFEIPRSVYLGRLRALRDQAIEISTATPPEPAT